MIRTERSLKSTVKVLDRPTQRKPELEKDNEELQLEKLVFGDDEGFNQALRTYHTEGSSNGLSGNEGDDTASEVGEELDDVADDDVC